MIDLHSHTTCSDGSFSPSQLVAHAQKQKISALAITDHDTIQALPQAFLTASRIGHIQIIPGIEISTRHPLAEVHILGYFLDIQNPTLLNAIQNLAQIRHQRNQKMIQAFQKHNIPISFPKLQKITPHSFFSRLHFAKFLINHRYVSSYSEAFQKYLSSQSGTCYVPSESFSPQKAIALIIQAQGIPVLAHPGLLPLNPDKLSQLVRQLHSHGLQGIEVLYPLHSFKMTRFLSQIAQKFNLQITGGSDFHGQFKPHIQIGIGKGSLHVPDHCLQQLRTFYAKNFS